MNTFAPYAKAILGALIAGLTALGTALTDGGVSASEWVAAAIATLVALGAVYAIPNAPVTGDRES
jgi:sugar phosphate permease